MSEIVFGARLVGRLHAVRAGDDGVILRMPIAWGPHLAGMIRTFEFPATSAHLDALRVDLPRELLLGVALEALCRRGEFPDQVDPDPGEVRRAIDIVLLGTEAEVESFVAAEGFLDQWGDRRVLVAHGGDPELLAGGEPFAALRGRATTTSDWALVDRQQAAELARHNRDEAARLGPLNTALLRYLGMFDVHDWHMGRHPDEVDPDLLTEVLAIVATADAAARRHARERREGPFIAAVQRDVTRRHRKLDETASFSLARLVEWERHRD